MEFYLDTADIEQVARFNNCLPLAGVTTNPTILAKSGVGVTELLPALAKILGEKARFHVQVVSSSVEAMLAEARLIDALPYDMVVKVPATEIGLAAIRQIKAEGMMVLATAIYSAQQGFLAALAGADYLAPYVNRIEAMGQDGVGGVADLQLLLDKHQLKSQILAASFKNTQQAMSVMKLGVGAITLPIDVIEQMFSHPAVEPAVEQFSQDWQQTFPGKLSVES